MDSAKVNLLAVIAVLTMLGSAMVYITNKDNQALKREIDIRIAVVVAVAAEIKENMKMDDLREQADLESKGKLLEGLNILRYDFQHLDEQLHIRHRLYDGKFESLTERVGKLETCLPPPKSR